MKLLVVISVLLSVFVASASNIEWNMLSLREESSGNYSLFYNAESANASVLCTSIRITNELSSGVSTLSATTWWLMSMTDMVEASYGEVIDERMFDGSRPYFCRDGGGAQDIVIDTVPATVHLAFTAAVWGVDGDGNPANVIGNAYGWVTLEDFGDVILLSGSACDLDGGAMYVGGGAVPEPTSVVLLSVGIVCLALRRNKA